MSELLTPKQVAARMNVHLDTVYDWVKLPNFPGLLRPRIRGRMHIDWAKFEKWNASRENEQRI